jgi:hypothetical protein
MSINRLAILISLISFILMTPQVLGDRGISLITKTSKVFLYLSILTLHITKYVFLAVMVLLCAYIALYIPMKSRLNTYDETYLLTTTEASISNVLGLYILGDIIIGWIVAISAAVIVFTSYITSGNSFDEALKASQQGLKLGILGVTLPVAMLYFVPYFLSKLALLLSNHVEAWLEKLRLQLQDETVKKRVFYLGVLLFLSANLLQFIFA